MRFRIDLKIVIFLVLFYFTKQVKIYALIIIFDIAHELGHLIAGLILGMKPESIELKPYGLSISFKLIPINYNTKIIKGNLLVLKKILVALSGPLINLIIIFVILNINMNTFDSLICIYANLILILFNLLPIYPLDGGRILKGILHIFFGKLKSEKYINSISFAFLLIITFLSSILIYYIKNISIFLIIVFLWLLYLKQDYVHKRKMKIYNLIEKTIEIDENK